MRKAAWIWCRLMPLGGVVWVLGSCGVTELQLKDFAASTIISVFSQSLTSVIEAFVIAQQGNA